MRVVYSFEGRRSIISPEVHQRVWRLVEAESLPVATKHEGTLPGYRVAVGAEP